MDLERVGEMLSRNLPHNNNDLIAFCAGLFDGEGYVGYAQYRSKRPKGKIGLKWNIQLEIAMADIESIKNFHDIVGVGTIAFKKNGKGSMAKKPQWRWRCSHRAALKLAKLFLPYSVSKRERLLKIINHYEFNTAKKGLGQS